MKIRQRTICHTCRARKLACDGRSPSCSQCLKSSRECGGYQYGLIFAEPQTTGRRTAGRKRITLSEVAVEPRLPTPGIGQPLSWPMNDILSLVVQNFIPRRDETNAKSQGLTAPSRVCGSWIEVVPDLKTSGPNGHALTSSIKAFAVAMTTCKRPLGAPIVDALAAHGTALSSLQQALTRGRNEGPDELSAAIMFLFLSEIMVPACGSYGAHIGGISRLMLSRGPAYYANGTSHRIFIGCRPSQIICFILYRRACFLEAAEWCTIPFQTSPAEPLQELMSIGACIPSLLQAIDQLETTSKHDHFSACIDKLLDVIRRLDCWRYSYSANLSSTYGRDFVAPLASEDIWYPDITVANSLTHYWAFWIICAVYAIQLDSGGIRSGRLGEANVVQQEAIRSKSNLIMRSVEYLTQKKMKLFGATSLGLPGKVAYEYSQQAGDLNSVTFSNKVIKNISEKGYSYLNAFIQSDFKILPLSTPRHQNGDQRGRTISNSTALQLKAQEEREIR
ncbi:N-terminal fungal transcription regulatory domain-containing protein [Metarhizium brunneum]